MSLKSELSEEREALPLSLLNDHLYCPRRAALEIVEGEPVLALDGKIGCELNL